MLKPRGVNVINLGVNNLFKYWHNLKYNNIGCDE